MHEPSCIQAKADPSRPRILLCWGYHRRTWTAPFERMSDQFDFVFLHHLREDAEPPATHLPVVHWDDFPDARALLAAVRPWAVVFMSVSSGRSYALRMAAARRGIPVAILDHGLRLASMADYARAQDAAELARAARRRVRRNLATLSFIVRSATLLDAPVLGSALLRGVLSQTLPQLLQHVPRGIARADRYIVYSPRNIGVLREQYGFADCQVDLIGFPEYDEFFSAIREDAGQNERYDLWIDSPLADDLEGSRRIGREDVSQAYLRLAEQCARDGTRLVVKLHPFSWGQPWRPEHPNITYLEDAELPSLLRGARHIYSFFSSLMLPAIAVRPTCLIQARSWDAFGDLAEFGVAPIVKLAQVGAVDVGLRELRREGSGWDRFVNEYLHKVDGRATFRLRRALASVAAGGVTASTHVRPHRKTLRSSRG